MNHGLVESIDRAGREGERAFCLQAWNGDTGHTIDRIGAGRFTLTRAACHRWEAFNRVAWSYSGGCAPGWTGQRWVDSAVSTALCPQTPRRIGNTWTGRPIWLRSNGRRVCFIAWWNWGRTIPRVSIIFAADAQELFSGMAGGTEAKIRVDDLHPAPHVPSEQVPKLFMPSLALLFELADRASSDGLKVRL